jgi:hypothetical protein
MVGDFDMAGKVLCLCRHDLMPNKTTRFIEAEYSQDSWVWKGKLSFTGGEYNFGILGCDNVFPYELDKAGYRVLNPSRHIKTTHLHIVNERSYSEKTRLPRPYLHVPVGGIDDLKMKERERLVINQPGKVGDILKVLPVAKWYHYKGFQVEWNCPVEYHSMFSYVDYVKPVLFPDQSCKVIDLSFGLNQKTALHRMWMNRKPTLDSFVTLKYELSEVPVSECFKLKYKRDEIKESALYDHFKITDEVPYILFHGSSDYGTPVDRLDTSIRVIDFKPVEGFTIFDWRKVIENAHEIHCIDSSLLNFVDVIDTDCKLVYYITSKVPDQADRTLLQKQWETVNMIEYV